MANPNNPNNPYNPQKDVLGTGVGGLAVKFSFCPVEVFAAKLTSGGP
jgi:hypothetical protein